MSGHLALLVQIIESLAEWRAKNPNDEWDKRSSEALSKLGKGLAELNPDDELVTAYVAAIERDPAIHWAIAEFQKEYIDRYGLDCPEDGDPVRFLTGFTEAIIGLVEKDEKPA
jgi:hypothetical protein